MTSSSQESLDVRYGVESSARLILDVAKAASSHLELAEVLEALIVALRPTIHFHAIAVMVIEGGSLMSPTTKMGGGGGIGG